MRQNNRFMRWVIFSGVVTTLVVAGALIARAKQTAKENAASTTPSASAKTAETTEQSPVMVTVAKVTEQSIQRTVDAVGSFQGLEEVTVTPKVTGRVIKICHDRQDIVYTGDVLLEIDPTDYKLAVEEASKAMYSELAKIGQTKLPPEDIDANSFVKQLPTYVRAENVESNSKAKVERAKLLLANKALSQEDFDQIVTDQKVATASRLQVELDAMATLATARYKHAQLMTAKQRLADTHVQVPAPNELIAGKAGSSKSAGKTEYVVAERMISEGEMSLASIAMIKGVFRLVLDKTLKLMATFPERYSSQIHVDQVVEVRVEAYPDRVFKGRVSRISPTVDPLSRTFIVEVLVPNENRMLKAGGFAKLSILTQTDAHALAVPPEAIVSFAGVNKVYVVRDGKAHIVEVSPETEGNGWREVKPKMAGELLPGAQVVTSGFTRLAEDVPVKVRELEKQ